MSLDVRRLEKARELAGGIVQARCPACAEGGGDRAGQHLRVYPDGRFGCCVHPKDREHRKRIFALAGDKATRSFTVKIACDKSAVAPAKSVASSLTGFIRTLRTPVSESVSSGLEASQASQGTESLAHLTFRTLRTPISNPRAYAREEEHIMCTDTHMYKESGNGVLSVLDAPRLDRLPYLTPGGTLVIPFDSPERFHWWKGAQSVAETRVEVMRETARKEMHGVAV